MLLLVGTRKRGARNPPLCGSPGDTLGRAAQLTSFLIRKKFLPLVGLLLHFVCKGEDSYVKAGQVVSIIGDTRSLTIEMDTAKDNSEPIAGTAWVGGYGKGTWLALPGDNGVSIIGGDVHSKSGLWVGTLDRVTGSFHVTLEGPGTVLRDGEYFNGTCQRSKKLF
jgi:hypothetical protein